MKLLLDESIDNEIETQLKDLGVETIRKKKGLEDHQIIEETISEDIPLITRDQADFVQLHQQYQHPGILIDKRMHLRDKTLVAETINGILNKHSEELENEIFFLTDFYGLY